MRLDKSAIVGTALGGGDGSSLADKLCELQTARDEEKALFLFGFECAEAPRNSILG